MVPTLIWVTHDENRNPLVLLWRQAIWKGRCLDGSDTASTTTCHETVGEGTAYTYEVLVHVNNPDLGSITLGLSCKSFEQAQKLKRLMDDIVKLNTADAAKGH